tara:strand:+ start:69 stop:431 length:363 start_codon:yes stop_codon:yes gene_type:complete
MPNITIPLDKLYELKDKKELIELIKLKNHQILKADNEVERLNNLIKFTKDKLEQAIKGNITSDPIVNRIIKKHIERHQEGMKNFGVTMYENDKPLKDWVLDAQQESMDHILYLEKILKKD